MFLGAVAAWTLITGSVSAEVFEQFGPLGPDYAALHENNLRIALSLVAA